MTACINLSYVREVAVLEEGREGKAELYYLHIHPGSPAALTQTHTFWQEDCVLTQFRLKVLWTVFEWRVILTGWPEIGVDRADLCCTLMKVILSELVALMFLTWTSTRLYWYSTKMGKCNNTNRVRVAKPCTAFCSNVAVNTQYRSKLSSVWSVLNWPKVRVKTLNANV